MISSRSLALVKLAMAIQVNNNAPQRNNSFVFAKVHRVRKQVFIYYLSLSLSLSLTVCLLSTDNAMRRWETPRKDFQSIHSKKERTTVQKAKSFSEWMRTTLSVCVCVCNRHVDSSFNTKKDICLRNDFRIIIKRTTCCWGFVRWVGPECAPRITGITVTVTVLTYITEMNWA